MDREITHQSVHLRHVRRLLFTDLTFMQFYIRGPAASDMCGLHWKCVGLTLLKPLLCDRRAGAGALQTLELARVEKIKRTVGHFQDELMQLNRLM